MSSETFPIPNPASAPQEGDSDSIESELTDLESQFAAAETYLNDGKNGLAKHLLEPAYHQLLKMEEKGWVSEELAASYHARAEFLHDRLYDQAA